MKLENKSQRLLPWSAFLRRQVRFLLFAGGLIVVSAGIGTWGYHALAGLSWIDSFHMACLILTGMGPVVEMKSTGAKLFDSLYALYSGVAFLTIAAVFFTPIVHRLLHVVHVDPEKDR